MNKVLLDLGKHMVDPEEIVYICENTLTKVYPDEDDIPCVKILFKNRECVNIGNVRLQQIRELMEKVNEKN